MPLKLGKRPARAGAVKLKLKDYVDLSRLPTPPEEFGHEALVTSEWGMLGNDEVGCCVFSGGDHETILWNAEAGRPIRFVKDNTLSDYSAVTGYNPSDPSTDNGTDMQAAAAYRQKVGLIDADGNRHKVGAYLAISPGNIEEHCVAAYLFGAIGIGIMVPDSAMDQFNEGKPWDVVEGSSIEGGHYVPIMARRNGMFHVCTWGKLQPMTDNFFQRYEDEAIAYLSPEALKDGKSLEGFDLPALQADLAALQS